MVKIVSPRRSWRPCASAGKWIRGQVRDLLVHVVQEYRAHPERNAKAPSLRCPGPGRRAGPCPCPRRLPGDGRCGPGATCCSRAAWPGLPHRRVLPRCPPPNRGPWFRPPSVSARPPWSAANRQSCQSFRQTCCPRALACLCFSFWSPWAPILKESDLAEAGGCRPVAHFRNLVGIALAAIGHPEHLEMFGAANRIAVAPELRGESLVGGVAQQSSGPPVLDFPCGLAGELESCAAVDRWTRCGCRPRAGPRPRCPPKDPPGPSPRAAGTGWGCARWAG